MPNLSLIPTQSLVAPENTAGGTGGAGVNEEVGGALSVLGQGAHLYEQHQDEQSRVWAGAAASDFHLKQLQATQAQRQSAVDAIAAGQPVPDMTGSFLTDYDKSAGSVLATAPNGKSKAYLQAQLTQSRAALGGQVIGQQAQLEREWKLSTADTTTQNGAKIVQQDPGQFDAQMSNIMTTMPHIDPATDAARALHARATLAGAAASSVLTTDPYSLRDVTNKALGVGGAKGPTGAAYVDAASPQEVETWNKQANARIAQIENAKLLNQNAAEAAAQTEHNKLADMVNAGQVPSLGYIGQVRTVTKGTSFADDSEKLIQLGTSGSGFGSLPLPAQSRYLASLDANATANGTDPDNVAARAQLEKINTTQAAAYKDNPLDAASRFAHVAVVPLQDISSTSQALDLVNQRVAALPKVEAAAGVPVSPLQPAEAQQLGKLLRAMQPDQAATAMSQLGASIGSVERIGALSKQIGDTDGAMGMAMAYAGNKSSQGRMVGELVLRGDQALRDKRTEVQVQQAEAWQATAATSIRGAFSDPTIESQAIQAAKRINAATALNGQDDMDAAVRMATGGITTHGAADAKIPLPYGMKADDFEKRLSALTPTSFAAQVPDGVVHIGAATMPLQQFVAGLHDATLVHAGQGQYNVRGGTTLATNAQGQRITIRIGP